MADPLFWPEVLPQFPQQDGYTYSAPNNSLRTLMEYGPAKTRRVSAAGPAVLQATYVLFTHENINGSAVNQKAVFLEFYADVDCVMSFWLPDPEDRSRYVLVKIRPSGDDKGVDLTLIAPLVWSLTLSLEVYPRLYCDALPKHIFQTLSVWSCSGAILSQSAQGVLARHAGMIQPHAYAEIP